MKKIIAISVMFALIAGAVFADTAVTGALELRFSLAKQQGAKDGKPQMGGSVGAAQIRLTGSNTDGTLGGLFNFRNTDTVRDPRSSLSVTTKDLPGTPSPGKYVESVSLSNASGVWYHRVYVWWKPVPQIQVFLGIDQDGKFDTAGNLGWSFHQGDNDYLFNHWWDFWRQIFPGNWDGFGLSVSFYPMPGLDLNLVFPTGGINWPQATPAQVGTSRNISNPDADTINGMIPGRLRFSGSYSMDFGKIQFAYIGGVANNEKGSAVGNFGPVKDNNGLFGLSAIITAIDGIAIQAGGSVALVKPKTSAGDDIGPVISAGLGVAYTGDGFGVKFRAGLVIQGDVEKGGQQFITGNIMPFFAVGEKGQVLVDIGVTNDGTKKDPVPKLGWSVIPAYRLSMEGGAFKIGLQVYNNTSIGGNASISGADWVRWNVPMLLAFNF
jgi:hypothetical protein